jgi:hypothetical protein
MKEELSLYGNEYSLFDTFYNGKQSKFRVLRSTYLFLR